MKILDNKYIKFLKEAFPTYYWNNCVLNEGTDNELEIIRNSYNINGSEFRKNGRIFRSLVEGTTFSFYKKNKPIFNLMILSSENDTNYYYESFNLNGGTFEVNKYDVWDNIITGDARYFKNNCSYAPESMNFDVKNSKFKDSYKIDGDYFKTVYYPENSSVLYDFKNDKIYFDDLGAKHEIDPKGDIKTQITEAAQKDVKTKMAIIGEIKDFAISTLNKNNIGFDEDKLNDWLSGIDIIKPYEINYESFDYAVNCISRIKDDYKNYKEYKEKTEPMIYSEVQRVKKLVEDSLDTLINETNYHYEEENLSTYANIEKDNEYVLRKFKH